VHPRYQHFSEGTLDRIQRQYQGVTPKGKSLGDTLVIVKNLPQYSSQDWVFCLSGKRYQKNGHHQRTSKKMRLDSDAPKGLLSAARSLLGSAGTRALVIWFNAGCAD
jgi:hypothetical protein